MTSIKLINYTFGEKKKLKLFGKLYRHGVQLISPVRFQFVTALGKEEESSSLSVFSALLKPPKPPKPLFCVGVSQVIKTH